MRRRSVLGAVLVLGALAVPSPAGAATGATVSAEPYELRYVAGSGQANRPRVSVAFAPDAGDHTSMIYWVTLDDVVPIALTDDDCIHPVRQDDTVVRCTVLEQSTGDPYIRMWLGDGDDRYDGLTGLTFLNDQVDAGSGNDVVTGAGYVKGGAGDDRITAGGRDAMLWGGAGDDVITGGPGIDAIAGDDGDDTLSGGRNDDRLYGGRGNDLVYGNSGDDRLWGNSGNDRLNGGPGADRFSPGGGRDTIRQD